MCLIGILMISYSDIELRLPAGSGVEVCLRGALGDLIMKIILLLQCVPPWSVTQAFFFRGMPVACHGIKRVDL